MNQARLTRRTALGATLAAAAVGTRPARAAPPQKITFLTSWFAQAEHGGFYQAKATGLYDKAGLDVDIRMGGPQVNGMQLLTAGNADVIMGYDIQVLNSIAHGLPVTTIATSFQFDLQGVMTHDDISGIADLKGHTILIASTSHATFWPWLKQRFGFTDAQAGVDTFNLQPFFVDKTVAVQAYPSSEPFEARRAGQAVKFFLFADDGYPPYGTTIVATNSFIEQHPDAAAAFVRASLEGWRDYLRDPAPANALIKRDNPKMTDDRIAYAVETMKAMHVLDRGVASEGIGTMTAARWEQTRDFLVKAGLLDAAVDWRRAFTTRFTDGSAHLGMSAAALQAARVAQAAEPSPRDLLPDAPVVELLSAEKVFANGARGLAPIDMALRRGEFVSLIGPSGCGKSTLLKLIANLSEPSDGRVVWWRGGFDRVGEPGRRLAFVFQDPTLMPWASVEANVRLPLGLAGVPRAEARRRAGAALAQVELGPASRRYPRQLSGGMRMRVSIARALVTEPDLLLMDEPFGALDEFTRNRLDEDLARLAWERHLTAVFVTHSIYEAIFLSTRIAVMAANPGRVFAQFTVDEPLPRTAAFRDSARFAALCRELSALLTDASIASRTA